MTKHHHMEQLTWSYVQQHLPEAYGAWQALLGDEPELSGYSPFLMDTCDYPVTLDGENWDLVACPPEDSPDSEDMDSLTYDPEENSWDYNNRF